MSTINERFRKLRDAKGLSQEDFASGAHRTRSEIKNIEYGKTTPKEEVILSVCAAYNVNEEWLRTGDGEMLKPIDRDEQIAHFLDNVMRSESDDFRRRLVAVLARLEPEEWELLEKMALELVKEYQTKEPGTSHLNIVKVAGRDGSYAEHALTDDDMENLRDHLEQLPEVPDDL